MLSKRLQVIVDKLEKEKELTELQEKTRDYVDNVLEDYWYELAYRGTEKELDQWFSEPFLAQVKEAIKTLKEAFHLLEKMTGDCG